MGWLSVLRRITGALGAIAALAALAGPGHAAPRPAAVGEPVRVTVIARPAPADTVTGRLFAVGPDALTLVLAPDSTHRAIPRDAIGRLEVQRRHGHGGTGALVGALVGGGALLLSVVLIDNDTDAPASPGGAAFGGALIGAMLGAFVGAAIETERWETVPLP